MTVVTICGTSGSGKSHLMRSFLEWAGERGTIFEEHQEGRVSPIGYLITLPKLGELYVCGAYETPTGGCDTIHNVSQVFDLVLEQHKKGRKVLYEGLFCMNVSKGQQLVQELEGNISVLNLSTPLATCFASINARRAERGVEELENKRNTTDNYKRAVRYSNKMRDGGAKVFNVTREQAFPKLLQLLGAEALC